MAGEIDNINFKVIINDKDFDDKLKKMEKAAKDFNVSVSQMLDLSNKLGVSTSRMSREQARLAEAQAKAEGVVQREAEKTAAIRVKAQQTAQREMERTASMAKINAEREQQATLRTVTMQERLNRLRQQGNGHMGTQSRLLRELGGYAAAYFSVRTVESFISSLIRVSGEFELQHRTLQAIVGDVDAADRIFSQLQVLAVKSPFSFADLTSYAKQLSAFSIPTEELYDTTKMLADVAAGLGVDMGRIILAFGQIRSSAVLRGQELRQLTEAGIPIIDELAKQFEELEGRAVSAGEVFDKISAREVPFEMVEKVFRDMTSEGGKFYNMQEIQAETLKAKVKNLGDQYDIMLYQIGQAQDGALKGGVDILSSLMEHWQAVGRVITSVAAGVGAYAAALAVVAAWRKILVAGDAISHLTRLVTHFGSLTKGVAAYGEAMKRAGKAMNGAFTGTVVGIIASIAVGIYQIVRAAGELDRTLDRIVNEKMSAAEASIGTLDGIVDRLGKAAKGSQDYRDALHDLNTKYGEFLPNLMTEKESLDEIKAAAEGAAEALRNKARASALAAGEEEIEKKYSPDLGDAEDYMVRVLQNRKTGLDRKSAQDVFDLFKNNIESGNFADGNEAFGAAARSYLGLTGETLPGLEAARVAALAYYAIWEKYSKDREKLEKRLAGNTGGTPLTQTEREGYNTIEAYYKEREREIRMAVQSEEETTRQLGELEKARLRNLALFYGGMDISLPGGPSVAGVDRPELAKDARSRLAKLDTKATGRARLVQEALASVGITKKTSAFGLWADEGTDFGNDGYYKELDSQYKAVIPSIQRAKESFVKLVGTQFDSADYDRLDDEGKRAYENLQTLLLRKKAIEKVSDALGYTIDDSRRARAATSVSRSEDPQLTALKARKDEIEDIRKIYEAFRPYMNEDNVTMRGTLASLYPDMDKTLLETLDFDAVLRKVAADMDRLGEAGKKAGDAVRAALKAKAAQTEAESMLQQYKDSSTALEKVEEMLENIRDTMKDIIGDDLGGAVNRVVDDVRVKSNRIDSQARERKGTIDKGELEYVELHGREAWEEYSREAKKAVDDWAEEEKKAIREVADDRIGQLGKNFIQNQLKDRGLDLSRLDKKSLTEIERIIDTIRTEFSDENLEKMITPDILDKAKAQGMDIVALMDKIKTERDNLLKDSGQRGLEKLKTLLSSFASILDELGGTLVTLGDAMDDVWGKAIAGAGSAFNAAGGVLTAYGKIQESLSMKDKDDDGKEFLTDEGKLGLASTALSGISTVLSTIGNQIEANRQAQKEWEQTVLESELAYRTLMIDRLDYEESNVFGVEDPLAKARKGVEQYEEAADELMRTYADLEDKGRVQVGTKKVASGKNIFSGAGGGAAAGAAIGTAVGGWALGAGTAIGAGIGAVLGGIASLFGAKKTVKVYSSLIDKYGDILDRSEGAGPFDLNDRILADYDKLDDDTKQLVDHWQEVQDKIEEIEDDLNDTISEWAGDIGTQLRDALVEAFRDGDTYSAIDDFHDYVTGVLEDLIAQTVLAAVFKDQFDQLQEDLKNSIYDPGKVNGKSWEDIIAEFGNSIDGGVQTAFDMLEKLQKWGKENGYDLFSPTDEDSSLSSGIKSITEDTASLLASYINAIRADVSVMRMGQAQGWLDVKSILSLMPSPSVWEYIAKIEAHAFDIAQTNADIAASSASMLQEIRSVITTETGAPSVRSLMQ